MAVQISNLKSRQCDIALELGSGALMADTPVHQRLTRCLDILESVSGYERSAVVLNSGSGDAPCLIAHARGRDSEDEFRADMKNVNRILGSRSPDGVVGTVLETVEPIVLNDVRESPIYISADHRMKAELCIGKPVGVSGSIALNVESSRTGMFQSEDVVCLDIMARQIAAILTANGLHAPPPLHSLPELTFLH